MFGDARGVIYANCLHMAIRAFCNALIIAEEYRKLGSVPLGIWKTIVSTEFFGATCMGLLSVLLIRKEL